MRTGTIMVMIAITLVILAGCSTPPSEIEPGHESDHEHTPDHHSDDSLGTESNVHASLESTPGNLQAGEESTLTFVLTDNAGNTVDDLHVHHGRAVHVVIIGEDLETIGHVHPEDFEGEITTSMRDSGRYPVRFTFPNSGRYLMALDAMNAEGAFSEHFIVEVEGDEPLGRFIRNFQREKSVVGHPEQGKDRYVDPIVVINAQSGDTYQVRFNPPDHVHAGQSSTLKYHFEKDGEPVTDLEPYLDAAMHFAIVKVDLGVFIHTHGTPSLDHEPHGESTQAHDDHQLPALFGPDLEVTTVFPEPGVYQIFSQAKHNGHLIVNSFMIEVEEGHALGTGH